MTTRADRTDDHAVAAKKRTGEPQSGAMQDESCRCKETAQMSPRELLERMMKDLAFWKKEKK
jgi:hypothetical protein